MKSSTAGPACGHATSAELDYISGPKTNILSRLYMYMYPFYGFHLMKPSGRDTYLGIVAGRKAILT
jgi:hypothetical protein